MKRFKNLKNKIPKSRFALLVPVIFVLSLVIIGVTTKKTVVATSCSPNNFSGLFDEEDVLAIFEGKQMLVPTMVADAGAEQPVLSAVSPSEKWIEVDLSEQKLRAWEGNNLFAETLVSTGLPWWPTPTGEFRIWVKLRATKMEGGTGRNYYYLPNVPYVMFFGNDQVPNWKGYGLHGTYWHNDFGRQKSHGCVNLPTSVAEQLYYWVTPDLPQGKSTVFASPQNTGTRVVIHD